MRRVECELACGGLGRADALWWGGAQSSYCAVLCTASPLGGPTGQRAMRRRESPLSHALFLLFFAFVFRFSRWFCM